MPPVNNAFASAILLTGSGTLVVDNTGCTLEAGEPTHTGDADKTVWYKWIAPDNTFASFDTIGTGGGLDTIIGAYTGVAVNALSQVAFNDDSAVAGGSLSRILFRIVAGVTYYIQVGVFDSTSAGNITLNYATHPNLAVPIGSPCFPNSYNDATPGLLHCLDRTTGDLLDILELAEDSGGAVDVTEQGVFATFDAMDAGLGGRAFDMYREPVTVAARGVIPYGTQAFYPFRCDSSGKFYFATGKTITPVTHLTSDITCVNCDGVPTGDAWVLPDLTPPGGLSTLVGLIGGIQAAPCAPSPDGTILYVSGNTSSSSVNNFGIWTVERYDLVNNVWLTPLATLVSTAYADDNGSHIDDLLVLPNGDVLVTDSYYGGFGTGTAGSRPDLEREALFVYRYNPDGTLAATYTIDATIVGNEDDLGGYTPRRARLASDPSGTSFWVQCLPFGSALGLFSGFELLEIETATGSVLTALDIYTADSTTRPLPVPDTAFFIHRAAVGRCGLRPQFYPQVV